MMVDSLITRARYLALALPLFALTSTLHAGCNAGANGLYYNTYGNHGNKVPSTAARPTDDLSACIVYRTDDDGYGGYYGPCDDGDGYGSGGYGARDGYGSDGGYGGHGP